jgi:hypothetical protein
MKILISPSYLITKKFLMGRFDNFFINFLKIKNTHKVKYLNGELNHYGEIININGKDKTFFLDEIHPIYLHRENHKYLIDSENKKNIDSYPSNIGYETPSYIKKEDILSKKVEFDCVIFSTQSNKVNLKLIDFFKKQNTKIILFDKTDHPEIYFDKNSDIYRGFNRENFDIYFKQDIPLGYVDKKIFPIAPVPSTIKVDLNDYKKIKKDFNSDFFFIGDYRKNISRSDRVQIINFLKKNFNQNTLQLTQEKKIFLSKKKIDTNLLNSPINISPSGKVWCSYRHCELVNYFSPIILPKPNCKTAPGLFEDMKNCIFYETEFDNRISNGDNSNYKIKNIKVLKEKIKSVLENKTFAKELFFNYYNLIKNFHTRSKRALYILNIISNVQK